MSKSTKFHFAAALVLVVFPLLVGMLSSTSSAIVAILLIGVGGYGFAVCLLAVSFWHRYRYGSWPADTVDLDDGSFGLRQEAARSATAEHRSRLFRANQVLQGWLTRHFSNV